jgi:hypothetical protein
MFFYILPFLIALIHRCLNNLEKILEIYKNHFLSFINHRYLTDFKGDEMMWDTIAGFNYIKLDANILLGRSWAFIIKRNYTNHISFTIRITSSYFTIHKQSFLCLK